MSEIVIGLQTNETEDVEKSTNIKLLETYIVPKRVALAIRKWGQHHHSFHPALQLELLVRILQTARLYFLPKVPQIS
jgi:hypothetical protein